ncbi:MAG: GNAT family N-acetyltransferase [Acidobacteria bacterium]|nr:GNAT family N-acetyltransferase [Acidobacteriota bacterium]
MDCFARVRPATSADIAAVAAIYGQYVLSGTASFELEAPSVEEMRDRFEAIVGRGLPYLVAIDSSGEVVGYAYAGAYRPRPAYASTVENSVYVHPRFVGKGIGQSLLAELIERCEALGLREMIAVIGDSANLASIRLHERAGFLYAGTLRNVGRKFGKWLDTVLMQRPLGPRP